MRLTGGLRTDDQLSGCQKASRRWLLHQSIMPPALFTLYVLAGRG
jgi:hypothetical protein